MRTLVDGQLWLSYSHAYVTSGGEDYPEPGTSSSGQVNGLCGAAVPGALLLVTGLHTGEVPITVELHDSEPDIDDRWEEIVEVSFHPVEERVSMIGCMGADELWFALDTVPHRVRYCAYGMEAANVADTRSGDEPEIDRYLLQFWPGPPGPDRIVRQTAGYAEYWHAEALRQPAPEELAQRRREQAEKAARDQQHRDEEFRRREEEQMWGGPRPADPLGSVVEAAPVAQLDRALAERLVRATPELRRAVLCRAVRCAVVEAGLDGIPWVAAAVDALDAGRPLPAPFDEAGAAVDRAFDDPAVTHTVVTTPDGRITNLSQQAMALCAVAFAADADPLHALFVAVQHAQLTFGRDRLDALHDVLHDVLREGDR